MKCRLHLILFAFFLITPFRPDLQAQTAVCYYQLLLEDTGADGWEGATLTVGTNESMRMYTLPDGNQRTVYLPLSEGDSLSVSYQSGEADSEVFFTLLTPAGDTVFAETGLLPFQGSTFSQIISCPACSEIPTTSVRFTDIRDLNATVEWLSPHLDGGDHLLRLGAPGFDPDTMMIEDFRASDPSFRLTGLDEKTNYELYLATICASGDTSAFVGPYAFQTLWSNDVGAVEIITPADACDIDPQDSVRVILQNFGGQPQTLIPFAYSVNGQEISIEMPRDGVYTGVLGKDSTDLAAFDQTFDFSIPGEYLVEVYTLLESDSMTNNDTTRALITSIPTISNLPYAESFEQWGGGWTVRTAMDGDTASWEHGLPTNDILDASYDGLRAWGTRLSGTYSSNEVSYLVSPCFDFSALTEDPVFSVRLNLDLETCCDGLRLEQSTDGGETWETVGRAGEAVNWYNNDRRFWSGTTGWFLASRTLTGLAGEADVRLRFVLQTDFANVREGVLIDALTIREAATIDLAATSVVSSTEDPCGTTDETLTINIANLGLTPLTAFNVSYQVNNGAVVTENVGALALVSNTQADYTFATPVNTTDPGTYHIKAWIAFDDDQPANDTAYLTIQTARSLPYAQDFETGLLPADWELDADLVVTDQHGNASFVLSDNLFSEDTEFRAATPRLGPVRPNEEFFFSYRFVDFIGDGTVGTELGPEDKLEIFVSTDCGVTRDLVTTIDQNNHTPTADLTEVMVDLSAYAGAFVQVYFVVTAGGESDYYFDLDNINVPACGDPLAVRIEQDNYINGGSQVTAVVDNQSGPFTYEWSTGETTTSILTPSEGDYQVTVTNAFGCIGVASTVVTSVPAISTLEEILLTPNPTTGQTWLNLSFSEPVTGEYRLLNATGQVLLRQPLQRVQVWSRNLDLSQQPAGLYFLQIAVDGQIYTEKLVRSRY